MLKEQLAWRVWRFLRFENPTKATGKRPRGMGTAGEGINGTVHLVCGPGEGGEGEEQHREMLLDGADYGSEWILADLGPV
jgi:hypothetical protein